VTAQQLFQQMMRDLVASALRELGTQGSVRRGARGAWSPGCAGHDAGTCGYRISAGLRARKVRFG
jgi:hypothetical protein